MSIAAKEKRSVRISQIHESVTIRLLCLLLPKNAKVVTCGYVAALELERTVAKRFPCTVPDYDDGEYNMLHSRRNFSALNMLTIISTTIQLYFSFA